MILLQPPDLPRAREDLRKTEEVQCTCTLSTYIANMQMFDYSLQQYSAIPGNITCKFIAEYYL